MDSGLSTFWRLQQTPGVKVPGMRGRFEPHVEQGYLMETEGRE
tara:strand:+ start:274 stop:402 length:129 start_codon:yes stop_codon:yes gene_type:complete